MIVPAQETEWFSKEAAFVEKLKGGCEGEMNEKLILDMASKMGRMARKKSLKMMKQAGIKYSKAKEIFKNTRIKIV